MEVIKKINVKNDNGDFVTVIPHMADCAAKDGNGQTIVMTYATKNELQKDKSEIINMLGDYAGLKKSNTFPAQQNLNAWYGAKIQNNLIFSSDTVQWHNIAIQNTSSTGAKDFNLLQSQVGATGLATTYIGQIGRRLLLNTDGLQAYDYDVSSASNDKCFTTKKYVSDATDEKLNSYAPMLRTTGTQNVATDFIGRFTYKRTGQVGGSVDKWVRLYHTEKEDNTAIFSILADKAGNVELSNIVMACGRSNAIYAFHSLGHMPTNTMVDDQLLVMVWTGSEFEIWYHHNTNSTNNRIWCEIISEKNGEWIADGRTESTTFNPDDYSVKRFLQ